MSENPNEQCVMEDEAVLVEFVEATMSPNHDRLMIRKWENIDPTYIDEVVKDLRMRTSMANPADKTTNSVKDPQYGDEFVVDGARVAEGRWRGVSVRGELVQGRGKITQTLAYGLVTTGDDLPTPELVGTEDSLFYPHGLFGTSEKEDREVRYRGIDPSYVETLKDTITLADGDRIQVRTVRMNDGSYNIHLLYETVDFVNTTPTYTVVRVEGKGAGRKKSTYRAPEVPIALAEGFVIALGATTGVSDAWSENGLDGEAIVYYTLYDNTSVDEETHRNIEQCGQVPSVTRTWYDVQPADIDTIMATAKTYTGETGDVGYATKEVFKEIDKDGVGTIRATAWKLQRRGQYVVTERYAVAKGQIPQVTKTWHDVPFDSISAIYTTASEYTGEAGDTDFIHKVATKTIAEDGCARIIAVAFKPQLIDAIEETHRIAATDGLIASVTRTWYGVSEAKRETIYNEAKQYLGEAGDTGFTHKEADKAVHDDGYSTIWATAWHLQRQGTNQETYRSTGGDGQRPLVRRTWFDVHPSDVEAIYWNARLYPPDWALWTFTSFYEWGFDSNDMVLKSIRKSDVQLNGYATITSEWWWNPTYLKFEEKTGQIEYQVVMKPGATAAEDWWRWARITYDLKVFDSFTDVLAYIDGGYNGSKWSSYNNYQFMGKKVTEISYSETVYVKRIDTNTHPPSGF